MLRASFGSNMMSADARARERLDFKAAAEVIEKAQRNKEDKLSAQQLIEMSSTGGMQFTSGGFEVNNLLIKWCCSVLCEFCVSLALCASTSTSTSMKMYPKREEFQWRPLSILCKRFDLIDPYMGKPPPAPRMRSKMDNLISTADSVTATKMDETVTPSSEVLISLDHLQTNKDSSDNGWFSRRGGSRKC